jgi:hypothetical protein
VKVNIKKLKSPSPKVLQTVVAVVFVVVTPIAYQNYTENNAGSDNSQQKTLLVVVENTQTENDSDSDGLADWEEALLGTDINNPDTDGDGTLDGVETELNRDPTVSGPNDEIEENIDSENLSFGSSTIDTNSFTMNAGIDLFKTALESASVGGGQINGTQILTSLQRQSEEILQTTESYSIEDINIVYDNSNQRLEQYFNNLITIMSSEFMSLENIEMTERDPNEALLETYRNISSRLAAIPVPEILSVSHVNYINSLSKIVYYYEVGLNEESDPLLAYYAIPKFRREIANSNRILEQIINYLKKNDIILETDEN